MEQTYPGTTPAAETQLSVADFIGPRIKKLCEKQGMTKYRLSELTGLTQTVLSNIIRKKLYRPYKLWKKFVQHFIFRFRNFFRVMKNCWN